MIKKSIVLLGALFLSFNGYTDNTKKEPMIVDENIDNSESFTEMHNVPKKLNTFVNQTWLARNIYHEARGEDILGWQAVADTTIQRVLIPTYPDTIKGVITQRNAFEWYDDPAKREFPYRKIPNDIKVFTRKFLNNEYGLLPPEHAFTFFTSKPNARWFKRKINDGTLIEETQIGNHYFYNTKVDRNFMIAMRGI